MIAFTDWKLMTANETTNAPIASPLLELYQKGRGTLKCIKIVKKRMMLF